MGRTDNRVTLRARHPYHTKSNIQKFVRTPGGKLVFQRKRKAGSAPKCGLCKIQLPGIPCLRPRQYHRLPKKYKNVNRAYGGNLCSKCVRDRILRSFMMDEARNVKNMMKIEKIEEPAQNVDESKKADEKKKGKAQKKE